MRFAVEMVSWRWAQARGAFHSRFEVEPSEGAMWQALGLCFACGGRFQLQFEHNRGQGRLRRLEMQARSQFFRAWAREYDRPGAYGEGVAVVHPAGVLPVETVYLLEGRAEQLPALMATFAQARREGCFQPPRPRRYLGADSPVPASG